MNIIIILINLIYLSHGEIIDLSLEQEMEFLSPSVHMGCMAPCDSYHSGANINSTLVCTYQASGVGTLRQNVELGKSCYPSYNCREDWNICIQWKEFDQKSPVEIPPDNPYSNLSNYTKLYHACSEITGLLAGGNSGTKPPVGGWIPTSLGWIKGSGNIGCGWGSTFSDVERNSPYSLEDFGRIELGSFSGNEVDCCMEAMKYESTDIKHGGAAIRFDVYNSICRIDREIMMRGNLDTSGGRPLDRLDHCGEEGVDFFYWRPAAGAADASNLQSSGVCAVRYNFTRVTPQNALQPTGRIPDGSEIPNRLPECEGSQPEMCLESLRYNAINTVEDCCEVCTQLRWLPDAGNDNTPCVSFQIVDGKCRILRKKWFDTHYGHPNLGTNPSGNKAMTITEVIYACSGFKDHDSCSRKDNSHGYWATCSNAIDVSVDNDCSYFSHMYFRDPLETNFSDPINNSTNSYTKVQAITLVNQNGTVTAGINISMNSSIITDRNTKRTKMINAPVKNIPPGSNPLDENIKGYGHNQPPEDITICSRISLYIKNPNIMYFDIHTNMNVFNPNRIVPAIYISNQCCNTLPQQIISSGRTRNCEVNLNISTEFIESILEKKDLENNRPNSRRLSSYTTPEFIIAYECVGSGKDFCDFQSNGNFIVPSNSNANTNLEIKSPSSSIHPVSPGAFSTPSSENSITPSSSNFQNHHKVSPSPLEEEHISPSISEQVSSATSLKNSFSMNIINYHIFYNEKKYFCILNYGTLFSFSLLLLSFFC